MPFQTVDEKMMERAIMLAEMGRGQTFPNPLVGALIAKDGMIIAEGFHQKSGGPHAEVVAIESCIQRYGTVPRDCDLYVTMEPCCIERKTPACTDLLLKYDFRRIVVGMTDPNPDVSGRGIKILEEQGHTVTQGILEKECLEQNDSFTTNMKEGRPFYAIKAAVTLDGYIADQEGQSKWITSEASRLKVHELRYGHQAILVGVGTVEKDDPSLNTRIHGVTLSNKIIVFDPKLRIEKDAKVFQANGRENVTMVVDPRVCNLEKKTELSKLGVQFIETPSVPSVDLGVVSVELFKRGISNVFIEGGSFTYSSFLREELVDKVYYFIAPKIIGGGEEHLTVFSKLKKSALTDAYQFDLQKSELVGSDSLLTLKRKNNPKNLSL